MPGSLEAAQRQLLAARDLGVKFQLYVLGESTGEEQLLEGRQAVSWLSFGDRPSWWQKVEVWTSASGGRE